MGKALGELGQSLPSRCNRRARSSASRRVEARPLAVSAKVMLSLHRFPREQLVELLKDDDAVGARPICTDTPFEQDPSLRPAGRSRPTALSIVDLPHPEGPRMT